MSCDQCQKGYWRLCRLLTVRLADCWGFGSYRVALPGVFDRRNYSKTRVSAGLGMVLAAQWVYVEQVEVQRHGTMSSMDSTAWLMGVSEHVSISSIEVSGEGRKVLDCGIVVMRLGFGQGIDVVPRCDCDSDCDSDFADTVYSQPWSLKPLLQYNDLNTTR